MGAESTTRASTDNASGEDAELRTNSASESHCYNCGSTDGHWAHECPDLEAEQQVQLHMHLGMQDEEGDEGMDEALLLLQFALLQGSKNKGLLGENRAYLNSCSTINAFKNYRYLSNIQRSVRPLKINCNTGTMVTKEEGTYGGLQVLNMPEGIANIFSMPELEKLYRITYDSWEGYYVVHTEHSKVRF